MVFSFTCPSDINSFPISTRINPAPSLKIESRYLALRLAILPNSIRQWILPSRDLYLSEAKASTSATIQYSIKSTTNLGYVSKERQTISMRREVIQSASPICLYYCLQARHILPTIDLETQRWNYPLNILSTFRRCFIMGSHSALGSPQRSWAASVRNCYLWMLVCNQLVISRTYSS